MAKARYTITTRGARTTVVLKSVSGRHSRALGTSNPPFAEIEHLWPKSKQAEKRSNRKRRR